MSRRHPHNSIVCRNIECHAPFHYAGAHAHKCIRLKRTRSHRKTIISLQYDTLFRLYIDYVGTINSAFHIKCYSTLKYYHNLRKKNFDFEYFNTKTVVLEQKAAFSVQELHIVFNYLR